MAGVWTNNWEKMRRAWAADTTAVVTTQDPTDGIFNINKALLRRDSQVTCSRPLSPLFNQATYESESYCTVRFGTSADTPSASDWNLGDPVTSGLTYVEVANSAKSYDAQTGLVTMTSTVAVMNSMAGSMTIKEWGLFGYFSGTPSSGANTRVVLLYRGVLDQPITLEHNWTLQLTITRTMQLEVLE